MKFYVCKHCGNIITFIKESGVPVVCCGEKMQELVPNTTDAAMEKHVPVIHVSDREVTVNVGSMAHPMLAEHYIQWIVLETEQGYLCKKRHAGDLPEAIFVISAHDTPVAAYAYCNLHGLWKAEV